MQKDRDHILELWGSMPPTDLKENVVWKLNFGCSSVSLTSGILLKLQLATAYTQTSEKSSL